MRMETQVSDVLSTEMKRILRIHSLSTGDVGWKSEFTRGFFASLSEGKIGEEAEMGFNISDGVASNDLFFSKRALAF